LGRFLIAEVKARPARSKQATRSRPEIGDEKRLIGRRKSLVVHEITLAGWHGFTRAASRADIGREAVPLTLPYSSS
jgi:hypothetical protein